MNLKDESTQRVTYFFLLYTLITLTYILGETCAISIFVNRFGLLNLPYFYWYAPVGIAALMFLFAFIADRFNKINLFLILFSVSIFFLIFSVFWGIRVGWYAAVLLFYIEMISHFLTVQFHGLLNDALTAKEARREVPLISTGWFVGSGIAGTTAQGLARSFHTQNLLLLVAALFAVGIGLLFVINYKFKDRLKRKRVRSEEERTKAIFPFIKRSRLFQVLLVSTLSLYLLYFCMNFQFLNMGHAFYALEDDFTAYFGIFTLVASVAGFFVQLFFTPKFISSFGIPRGVMVTPLVMLAGGAWLFFSPILTVSFCAFLLTVLIKDTIYFTSFQLYFNQVESHIRTGIRNLVEGVMAPVGGIFAGIIILLIGYFFGNHQLMLVLPLVVCFVSVGWFIFAFDTKKEYEKLLYRNTLSDDFELRLNLVEALQERNNVSVLNRVTAEIKDLGKDLKDRSNLEAILIHTKGGEAMAHKSRTEYQVMKIIHGTRETPRFPKVVVAGHDVVLTVATLPKKRGKAFLWVNYDVTHLDGSKETRKTAGNWTHNAKAYSFWAVSLGSFRDGDKVDYLISLQGDEGAIIGSQKFSFAVGPYLYLNIILLLSTPAIKDSDLVRMHAIYYYYEILNNLNKFFKNVYITINLTPVMFEKLLDYLQNDKADRGLAILRKSITELGIEDKEYLLKNFFQVDSRAQIDALPRFQELWDKRDRSEEFTAQDLLDLMACYHLAWFSPDFQKEEIKLDTGELIKIDQYVKKGRDFNQKEIIEIADEQIKLIRSLISIILELEEQGRVEFSVSPYYNANLPLIYDSDIAGLKNLPARFSFPQDARAQIEMAVSFYKKLFKKAPKGMWPPAGSLSSEIIHLFSGNQINWVASDMRTLGRSDNGYDISNPDVVADAYKLKHEKEVACFFSEDFILEEFIDLYAQYLDKYKAADDFISKIKYDYAYRVQEPRKKILTLAVDAMTALEVLRHNLKDVFFTIFDRLNKEKEIITVTPSQFIEGNEARGIAPHPVSSFKAIEKIACSGWYAEEQKEEEEISSWIGSPSTNYAWELLRKTREDLGKAGVTPETNPLAYRAAYQAEASDWFLWYSNPDSYGLTQDFDVLFRNLLKEIYIDIKRAIPQFLETRILPPAPYWDPGRQIEYIEGNKTLTIQTSRPGKIKWGINGWDEEKKEGLLAAPAPEGFKADVYRAQIDVYDDKINEINFTFIWDDGTQDKNDYRILIDWGYEQILKGLPTRDGRFL